MLHQVFTKHFEHTTSHFYQELRRIIAFLIRFLMISSAIFFIFCKLFKCMFSDIFDCLLSSQMIALFIVNDIVVGSTRIVDLNRSFIHTCYD